MYAESGAVFHHYHVFVDIYKAVYLR